MVSEHLLCTKQQKCVRTDTQMHKRSFLNLYHNIRHSFIVSHAASSWNWKLRREVLVFTSLAEYLWTGMALG